MKQSRIKPELEKRKNEAGLVGTRLELKSIPGETLSAHMTHDWKTISISYGTELNLVPDDQTRRFAERKGIHDPELKVGLDLTDHEAGHRENPVGTRRGCPYTVEMHDAIKESVHLALAKKGKSGLESYVTNAFEDVLDNINCRTRTDFSGQTLFWNNQGLIASKDGKYNPFYEAFVRINLHLGGNVVDNTLLKRFYDDSKEVREAMKGFLGDMKDRIGLERVVRLHEKPEGFKRLFTTDLKAREHLWTGLAHSFASHLADLLDENNMPKEMMFGSGEGKPSSNSGEEGDGNPFDKEMKDPKVRQEIAYERYQQGKGPAAHRDNHEQLYDLYKRISREIVVKTSTYTEAASMPLVHHGRRFLREDETSKLRFRGIGINPEGEFGVKTTRHSIDYPVAYKTHPRKFPKFKLALMDRSGSMRYNIKNEHDDSFEPKNIGNTTFIPWGDKSKHHYALKGYFGVENYLERQGIGPYVECGILGFSGEEPFKGDSKSAAKKLLQTPSGGTSLDISGLEEQLEEGSLVLSISDGEMSLSAEEQERFEKKIRDSDFAHIQIGGETSFSRYLKSIGVPVFLVKGDDDLSATMIDFVSGYYNKVRKGDQK